MNYRFEMIAALPARLLGLSAIALTIGGCATEPAATPREQVAVHPFKAPLGQLLRVETGNALFVSGSYIDGEDIQLPRAVDMMVPGSMFIPFPVRIEAGPLTLRRIGTAHRYYCAAEGRAAASFPGLGSVLGAGDCVGIRIPLGAGSPEWVVDNSNHNRTTTIWTKGMTADERAQVQVRPSMTPFMVKDLTRILFDGYFDRKLHFTLIESKADKSESRTFTFDFTGEPTVVGVRGNQWQVMSANNLEMSYQWVKIANP